MNTRQLRHFLAVMELGSLSAAAAAVHLSPPALSRSLRALEDELRVSLFDRLDRRLRPTPYALAYQERARRIVFDEKEGARSLALMRSGDFGPLSFGMGSSIANMLMSPMMLELLAEAPGLRISAMVESSDALLDALSGERLDFFVGDVGVAAHDGRMTAEPLYRCTFGWYARRQHPLAKGRGVSVAELARFPLVASGYLDESHARRMAERYAWALPFQDHFQLNTNDVAVVHALVTSSDAIAPLSDIAALAPLRARAIVRLDVKPAPDLDMTLGIVRRTGRTLVPAAERAFRLVRAYFAAAAGKGRDAAGREPPRRPPPRIRTA
jgi:DNA-binding transcriptional LysR family regulator